MKRRWTKLGVSCLTILALTATLGLSCGGNGGQTVVIGNLTDLSGVGASALEPMTWALEDMVKEINEEEPVPGVQFEVMNFDTAFDTARFVPGYQRLKDRGAKVIISVFSDATEALMPLAERDKVPVLGMATTLPMIEDPGWVFAFSVPGRWSIMLMLDWIAEQWEAEGKYDTVGKPTLASTGWDDGWGREQEEGARDYCAAFPDKFEYVSGNLAPVGTTEWVAEVKALKNVDYVSLCGTGALQPATFIKQYRDAGGTGTFISTESPTAYLGYIVDYCGWDAVDGSLNTQGWGWWHLDPTEYPDCKYVKDVVYKHHEQSVADDLVHAGMGYLGGGAMQKFALDILVEAVRQAGFEDFDGQAYYDTAVQYMVDWSGSQRGFTETRRYVTDEMVVLRWDAAEENLILASDGWVKIAEDLKEIP